MPWNSEGNRRRSRAINKTLDARLFSPCFVDGGLDLDKVAERFVVAKWLNSGQTCLDPDYILTTDDVRPKLVESLTRTLRKVYGDDARRSPRYSRIVGRRQYKCVYTA